MSVYGGDSLAREAQYRKRRVNDLLIEGVDASVYKKLSSGKFACLICPNNPVLDTSTVLVTHVNGSRHRVAESRRRDRELAIQDEVEKRMALSGGINTDMPSSASSIQMKMEKRSLIEQTRKAASEALSGEFVRKEGKSESNISVPPYGKDFVPEVDASKTCEGVVGGCVVSVDYRKRLEMELKFTAAGWKRDGYGRWFRDENAEFDSDEEDPNVVLNQPT